MAQFMNGPGMTKRHGESDASLGATDDTTNEEDGNQEDGPTENLLMPGTKISKNDFITLKVIGRGSFGKVYLVRKKDNQ